MSNSCKSLVLPAFAAFLMSVGCAEKKVALRPPPQPDPTVTAVNRTDNASVATTRIPPPEPPRTPNVPAKSDYPDQATRDRIDTLLGRISDAYFDYDKHSLRADAISTLQADSVELRNILRDYPGYKLIIEGYADERGSDEYNLGLGDARALSAKNFLVEVGIPAQQLSTVSFGRMKPICTDHTEACWQKNRRIHIVAADRHA